MVDPEERLHSGDIYGARSALVEMIRKAPGDQRARMFLFQLLAIMGDWDRADTQLRTLAQLSPEAQMLAAAYGPVLKAEKQRSLAFVGEAPVPVLTATSAWVRQHADATSAFAGGRGDDGERLRKEAFDAAPDTPGTLDGHPFLWIADEDPRFGPCLEVIVAGRWGLTPFEAVSEITSEGPIDLRDTVWLPVQMTLRSGQTSSAFLPVLYPGTSKAEDPLVRLGRSTIWRDGPGGPVGLGRHVLMLDNGQELDILSLRTLSML